MSLNETLNLLSYIQDIYDIDLLEIPCKDLSISIIDDTYFVTYIRRNSSDVLSFGINIDNVKKYFED